MKRLIILLLITSYFSLLAYHAHAQSFLSLSTGKSFGVDDTGKNYVKRSLPVLSFGVGYAFKNADATKNTGFIEGEMVVPLSQKKSPVYFGVKTGPVFNIGNAESIANNTCIKLLPAVGASYAYASADDTRLNKWCITASVKAQYKIYSLQAERLYKQTTITLGITANL